MLTREILTERHRSAGLELTDDDHCVYLWQRGTSEIPKLVAVFSAMGVVTESLVAEALVKDETRWLLYYGAADRVCCLAIWEER